VARRREAVWHWFPSTSSYPSSPASRGVGCRRAASAGLWPPADSSHRVATPARTSQGLLLSRAIPLRGGGSRLPSSRQLDRCRQRGHGSVVRHPSNRGEVAPPGSISAGRLNVGSQTSHLDETTSWTPSQPIWPAAGQRGAAGPSSMRRDNRHAGSAINRALLGAVGGPRLVHMPSEPSGL
jgi:hypothetical protein